MIKNQVLTAIRPNRIMPTLIANSIMGVSPMTGPSALVLALHARYGTKPPPEWPMMKWDCDVRLEYEVTFHSKHPVRENARDVVMWALQHCKGLHSYTMQTFHPPHPLDPTAPLEPQIETWVWSFADADDALWFKMRWL